MTAVLGFDTATHATVVGLRVDGETTLQARDDPPQDAQPGHATRALTLARELLEQAGVRWGEIGRIAVGVGPGRFTGLRVGIATARGLAQSLGVELVGVSTLRALALGASRATRADDAQRGTIAIVDARRGEAFAAAYPASGAGEIAFEQPLRPAELRRIVEEVERRDPSAGGRWQAVGDGAVRFAAELREAGAAVAAGDSPLHLLDAAALCELAACADAVAPLAAVLPDYRRAADATIARERALSRAAGGVAA
jgi:tRNA threonylcarbamoyladenosine biosynthesis protein TsaB